MSLKILCGFSNKEIARALLKKEDAIAKAYTRERTKMKTHVKKLESPIVSELNSRLESALKVIYLMFNEGYNSSDVNVLIKKIYVLKP